MDYQEYKTKAQMAHSEKTIKDRKSYLRLFDVWLYQLRKQHKEPGEAIMEFRGLDRDTRMNYEFSDYSPAEFSEIQRFILFLYEELDFSRTQCRHYFDAIQSYSKRLNLDVYSREQFQMFREDNLSTSHNPNYDSDYIFRLSEVKRLVDSLSKPQKDFVLIQYLHCRRPGEVKELRVRDFDLTERTVIYHIKKQQYGEDNLRDVQIVNSKEAEYLSGLIAPKSGKLFPEAYSSLENIRKPFRDKRDELGLSDLPLKNLRHSRISHLKAVGWESEKIRDSYTHHKNLSTLQDRYLTSVDEEFTEQELWTELL